MKKKHIISSPMEQKNKMKIFVNSLSIFRIIVAFTIILTLLYQLHTISLILFILAALSDWLDGFLARKYNVCSNLGGVLDHIGDKLLVCNTLIMLALMMPIWFIIVPIILMIALELYVSGLREFLGTQKITMPVPKPRFSMGKIKTALQMFTIIVFLCLFVLTSFVNTTNISQQYLSIMKFLSSTGIICIWLSLCTSLISAIQYTLTFAKKLEDIH